MMDYMWPPLDLVLTQLKHIFNRMAYTFSLILSSFPDFFGKEQSNASWGEISLVLLLLWIGFFVVFAVTFIWCLSSVHLGYLSGKNIKRKTDKTSSYKTFNRSHSMIHLPRSNRSDENERRRINRTRSGALDDMNLTTPIGQHNKLERLLSNAKYEGQLLLDSMVSKIAHGQLNTELRRPKWLSLKYGVEAAVNKIKERRKYSLITSEAKQGDGLKSIFSDHRLGMNSTMLPPVDYSKVPFGRFGSIQAKTGLQITYEEGDKYDVLRGNTAFSWLPEPILRLLCTITERVELKRKQVLYNCGNVLPFVFIVLSGKVNVKVGALPAESGEGPLNTSQTYSRTIYSKSSRDIRFRTGEGASCLTDLLAMILGVDMQCISTAYASQSETVILKIDSKMLQHLFSSYQGLREEWIHRILTRLSRVTFMTLNALSGQAVLQSPDISTHSGLLHSTVNDGKILSRTDNTSLALRLMSRELGIGQAELKEAVCIAERGQNFASEQTRTDDRKGSKHHPLSVLESDEINATSDDNSDFSSQDGPINIEIIELSEDTDIMDVSEEPSIYIVMSGKLQVFSHPEIKMFSHSLNKKKEADEYYPQEPSYDSQSSQDSQHEDEDLSDSDTSVTTLNDGDSLMLEESLTLEYEVEPSQSIGHFAVLTGTWEELYIHRSKFGTDNRTPPLCICTYSDDVIPTRPSGQDVVDPDDLARSRYMSEPASSSSSFSATGHSSSKALPVVGRRNTTTLIRVSETSYWRLLHKFPQILEHKGKELLSKLSLEVRMVDTAIRWINTKAGEIIVKEGRKCNFLYVVLHGRLVAMKRHMQVARKGNEAPPIPEINSITSTVTSGEVRGKIKRKVKNARKFQSEDKREFTVCQLSRGSTVGELSLLTNQKSPITVRALRYSQLAAVPVSILRDLMVSRPEALMHLGWALGRSIEAITGREMGKIEDERITRVVTIIPASPQAPVDMFTHTLAQTLEAMNTSVQVLNSSLVEQIVKSTTTEAFSDTFDDNFQSLSRHRLRRNSSRFEKFDSSPKKKKLDKKCGSHFKDCYCTKALDRGGIVTRENIVKMLNEVEDSHDIVLMVCDPWMCNRHVDQPTWWSSLCVEQADIVFHVVNAMDTPTMTSIEKCLTNVSSNARHELVLLYFEQQNLKRNHHPGFDTSTADGTGYSQHYEKQFPEPEGTRLWVENRGGIHQHHHIRCHPKEMDKVNYDVNHYKSDFRRLSRWILGRSIGLVLGGGGARGCAHLSAIRALENQGIPIDFVAGTSIGAFMGGLYAWKTDNLHMHGIVAKFASEMSSVWKKLRDLTFPVVSYFKGMAFNRSIVKMFEGKKIEDLWLPYFCISTDLTDSEQVAHRNGALWRYVRASMTLVNFMPPICDVDDAKRVHYLADGGYCNNLPVDLMRKRIGHHGTIIAVDVQTDWTIEGDDYGDHLDGWWFLFQMLNPFVDSPKIPTSSDIQTQLAYISSVQQGGVAKPEQFSTGWLGDDIKEHIDLFLHPPVEEYGTLEFSKNKEIQLIGFEYAQKKVIQWVEEMKAVQSPKLEHIFGPEAKVVRNAQGHVRKRRMSRSRNSLSWSNLNFNF